MDEGHAKQLVEGKVGDDAPAYDYDNITSRYWRVEDEAFTAESVCRADERVKVTATNTMPYMAICKLYMRSPSGRSYIGTGWLSAPNKLYTAGHCVYDVGEQGFMTSITVVPGLNGLTKPFGEYRAVSMTATRGWIDNGSHRYDMGLIKLDRPVTHGQCLRPELADPSHAEVCGYPGDRDTGIFQYKMTDIIGKSGGQFNYMIDTFGGQSGAPVLRNRYCAVGIHNYGGCPNSASDLYESFVEFADNW
ncbi:MAG: trypsin-like serine peptidase [Sandaracinaceae bacterium]